MIVLETSASAYMLTATNKRSLTSFEIPFAKSDEAKSFGCRLSLAVCKLASEIETGVNALLHSFNELESAREALAEAATWVSIDACSHTTIRVRFPHRLFDAQGGCIFLNRAILLARELAPGPIDLLESDSDPHLVLSRPLASFEADKAAGGDRTVLQKTIKQLSEILPDDVRLLVAESGRNPESLSIGNNFMFLDFSNGELGRIANWPRSKWRRFLDSRINRIRESKTSPLQIEAMMSSDPRLILTNPGVVDLSKLLGLDSLKCLYMLAERVPHSKGITVSYAFRGRSYLVFSNQAEKYDFILDKLQPQGWLKERP